MAKRNNGLDRFFVKAEQLAVDYALIGGQDQFKITDHIDGLLSVQDVEQVCEELKTLSVDEYIDRTVMPSEDKSRLSSKALLKKMGGTVLREISEGPLYAVEMKMTYQDGERRVGFLAQERSQSNGAWMPEHHLKAVEVIREFAHYGIPIVTFIDTPGADAGEIANENNQAHSISHLITEMANIDLPTIGIVLGYGYSGGAIPLATTNLLFSVRDGVFNTIQPRGLASIARKYNLSWQECAKYVGISSYELCRRGYLDGVIDFIPEKKLAKIENLEKVIETGIRSIEQGTKEFVKNNDYVFDHYKRSIERYLRPSESLKELQKISSFSLAEQPTGHLNVFGAVYRYLRYLSLRKRIYSTTTSSYSRLSHEAKPEGDLKERRSKELEMAFSSWLEQPLEIRYDDLLLKTYRAFEDKQAHADDQRGRISRFIFGDPKTNYDLAQSNLCLIYGFHLYNLWKDGAQSNFLALTKLLQDEGHQVEENEDSKTVLNVLYNDGVREKMVRECKNFVIFDFVYDQVIFNLRSIAREAKDYNIISRDSVQKLISSALHVATEKINAMFPEGKEEEEVLKEQFYIWLRHFVVHSNRGAFLKSVEEWKKIVHPRFSEPLFAILTFFFEHLILQYFESEKGEKTYDGRINIRNIGIKDFWNRLRISYHDLLIQDVLLKEKQNKKTPQQFLDHFFYDFEELNAELMSLDPVQFPGFRESIEKALSKKVSPCGLITGMGRFKSKGLKRKVGIAISNLGFQAGSFDMASAEKFCKLLVVCATKRIPVVCFISSGGMQTKEGAGSLFSMSIVNDRITRFVRDNDLPIICFGFGDCTGGAQASFVTHPLVQTYYFSGTNMPFAGQIVVPSYLPSTSTLSNYLSIKVGSMQGLVVHPFNEDMDRQLKEIDDKIPIAKETVEEVCARVLKGILTLEVEEDEDEDMNDSDLMKSIRRVLIHARGCTAVKLIKIAQACDYEIVLAQSDPDIDSVPAEMLREQDRLVCIGGNTPDESYLNAQSIIRVAEQEKADSLHPGIGFLSENSAFAGLCRNHGINFIGPSVHSMEVMGNKSNAINTAMKSNVPVVPGSHGILADVEHAKQVADEIGYPVLIKAVHGGGGKGIQVVEKEEDFKELYLKISAEAKSAFGSGDVYLEKYITELRHVEVQILRDSFGSTKVLGLRDCSVQRNNQKIIEESCSTMLPEHLEKSVYQYAEQIANEVNYFGAGTVEFIYDLKGDTVYFMEMNTRLQVEHPVTEFVTGIDIVKTQFEIASGKSIKDLLVEPKGYAVEVRITAEKAALNGDGEFQLLPNPGDILEFQLPEQEGIEVIACVEKGKKVTPYYDSLIMQVIAKGDSRDETLDQLLKFLKGVKVSGVCTNIPLVCRIIEDEVFRKGIYNTCYLSGFLERIDVQQLIQDIELASGDDHHQVGLSEIQIEDSDELKVLAPSAGIFYSTPSPAEPGFVEENDEVDVGQTLCLLEAMKLFTSISLSSFNQENTEIYESQNKFQIVKRVAVNGQAVNKGDLLFVVRPLKIAIEV